MISKLDCQSLYQGFQSPITKIDCGTKCAPFNEKGVPFCCDTRHAIPAAYRSEWEYLQTHTDLWHEWQASEPNEYDRLRSKTPEWLILIECKGHQLCQRAFRSFTCRSFPFFPYIDQSGKFIGLSYYWEYEERCWVISHLEEITLTYLEEFFQTYQKIMEIMPEEHQAFRYHSGMMRRIFSRKHRAMVLVDFQGRFYKITPRNGRKRRLQAKRLPKFGPYRLADLLPFPDETR